MKMTSISYAQITALVSLSLLAHEGAAAQAYVDQVNRGAGHSAYVEQMPAGAKPAVQKHTSSNKTKPYSKSSKTSGEATANASGAVRADVVPSVGTGSSAIVRLGVADSEWPTVGRGTVSR